MGDRHGSGGSQDALATQAQFTQATVAVPGGISGCDQILKASMSFLCDGLWEMT